jgi:hypothetical protein
MTGRRLIIDRVAWVRALGIAGLLGAGGLSGCADHSPVVSGAENRPFVSIPLATSIGGGGGAWAVVPMGHLSQPLETFWQLLYLPRGSRSWSDQVRATATGTNGGLVLAASGAQVLDVGIRPSNKLTFSPMITTSDDARSWTNGLLTPGLAPYPTSLATSRGHSVALIGSGGSEEVEASTGSLSNWSKLTTLHGLATTPTGKACGLAAITSVGLLGSRPLIGGSCTRDGVVPIFLREGRRWVLATTLPVSGVDRAEVLWMMSHGDAESVMLGVVHGKGLSLVVDRGVGGKAWSRSAPLPVARGASVTSVGSSPSGVIFVVLSNRSGFEALDVLRHRAWQRLPTPPAGTSTVVFTSAPQGEDALVPLNDVLTVWHASLTGQWTRTQRLRVPIQYGSAS